MVGKLTLVTGGIPKSLALRLYFREVVFQYSLSNMFFFIIHTFKHSILKTVIIRIIRTVERNVQCKIICHCNDTSRWYSQFCCLLYYC